MVHTSNLSSWKGGQVAKSMEMDQKMLTWYRKKPRKDQGWQTQDRRTGDTHVCHRWSYNSPEEKDLVIDVEKQNHSPIFREKGDFPRGLCSPRVDHWMSSRKRGWIDIVLTKYFQISSFLTFCWKHTVNTEWQLKDDVCWVEGLIIHRTFELYFFAFSIMINHEWTNMYLRARRVYCRAGRAIRRSRVATWDLNTKSLKS